MDDLASRFDQPADAIPADQITAALLDRLEHTTAAGEPLPYDLVKVASRLIECHAETVFETVPAVRRVAQQIAAMAYYWRTGRHPPAWMLPKLSKLWEPTARHSIESGALDIDLPDGRGRAPVHLHILPAHFQPPPLAPLWWAELIRKMSDRRTPRRRKSLNEILASADTTATSAQQTTAELRRLCQSLRSDLLTFRSSLNPSR